MLPSPSVLKVLSAALLILSGCSTENASEPAATAIPTLTVPRTVVADFADGRATLSIETDVSLVDEAIRGVLRPLAEAARALPRSAESEGWRERGATHLRDASVAASSAGLTRAAAYLETVATAVEGDAGADLDAAWPGRATGDLVAVAGRDGELFHLQVGLVDDGSRRWIEPFLARLGQLEATLPLPADLPAEALGPKRDTLIVADVIERGGTLASSASLSTFLPAERARRVELGATYVFWKSFLEHRWFKQELLPAIPRVLAPEHQDAATARAHLFFYATRFGTYQLGPQTSATADGRVPLRERFADLWGPLVIAKADLLFFLVHEWLIDEGVQPPEVSRENAAMLVLMGFRALADSRIGEAPSAHEPAAALQLNFLRARGAVVQDSESGLWHLDEERLRLAVRELVGEIFEVHASGDVDRAHRLFETYGEVTPEIEATVRRLSELEIPAMEAKFSVVGF